MSAFLVNEGLVLEALREVIDPELGVNVVDLGLIYDVAVTPDTATITMTLTTPGCPLHASIRSAVEQAIGHYFPDIQEVAVDLVWEPRWRPEMITPEGREELGWR